MKIITSLREKGEGEGDGDGVTWVNPWTDETSSGPFTIPILSSSKMEPEVICGAEVYCTIITAQK